MSPPLDSRIANWQSDGHEIGMVEFHPTKAAKERFPYYHLPDDETFIGVVEADALCVHLDGSLRVYDHESQNRILCPAATDQRSFVAAMIELEQHFERCVRDEKYCDDMDAAATVRDRCVELAGGDDYFPFFTSMLGV
jgi:hypothetical protein